MVPFALLVMAVTFVFATQLGRNLTRLLIIAAVVMLTVRFPVIGIPVLTYVIWRALSNGPQR